jgi:hypothetical protein
MSTPVAPAAPTTDTNAPAAPVVTASVSVPKPSAEPRKVVTESNGLTVTSY